MAYNKVISVCVITYNSAQTVLETLDSLKAQTYQNLELIISDDCSKDETIKVCKSWLMENSSRFCRTLLITYPYNTGTVNNLNRGVAQCHGEWIKCIAGDDAFTNNFFKDLSYYLDNPKFSFIIVPLLVYENTFEEQNHKYNYDCSNCLFFEKDTSAGMQHKVLLRKPVPGAGFVIKKDVYDKIGFYDSKYPFFEDRPYSVKVTGKGIRLDFAPCYGVKYRVSSSSIERRSTQILSRYHLDSYRFQRDVLLKEVGFVESLLIRLRLFCIFRIFKSNRNVLTDKARKQLHLIERFYRYIGCMISIKYMKYLMGMKKDAYHQNTFFSSI